jgi:hypothetical protein
VQAVARVKAALEAAVKQVADPKGAAKKVWDVVRWRGGLMDTYLTTGTTKTRKDGGEQWAYRYPAPG